MLALPDGIVTMYNQHFKLDGTPFSIAPDPRFLYMSAQHREALAHLLYGVDAGGGFVLLTGEIGTGKTTVCRCFLQQVPAQCRVAYIFNPRLSADELLLTVCQEYGVEVQTQSPATRYKDTVDALNRYLLKSHADGCNNVLVIDEAQNLSAEVLEQLRLLTNLETNERKLLQIILIGQPQLRELVQQSSLEQLAQRIIARYHLGPLSREDCRAYIVHRLAVAGSRSAPLFSEPAMALVHRLSRGVPRKINLLCDRAMLAAYAKNLERISAGLVREAAREVLTPGKRPSAWRWSVASAGLAATAATAWLLAPMSPLLHVQLPVAAQSTPGSRGLVPKPQAASVALPVAVATTAASAPGEMVRPVIAEEPAASPASISVPTLSFLRLPRDFREEITPGARGADVDWVAKTLASWSGSPTPALPAALEGALLQRLKQFQQIQGLKADGVVGPRTWMRLNLVAGGHEPRLEGLVQAGSPSSLQPKRPMTPEPSGQSATQSTPQANSHSTLQPLSAPLAQRSSSGATGRLTDPTKVSLASP